MTILNSIIPHIDTIIIAIVAIILGWDRFRSGSNTLRQQIAADYKERNTQLEEKVRELELSINAVNTKVATLSAIINEKDKRIAELREDLQGRNPDILKLLQEISKSNIEIKNFMQMMHTDSREERKHQTEILEGQVRRELNIDKASIDHTGNPMRIDKR